MNTVLGMPSCQDEPHTEDNVTDDWGGSGGHLVLCIKDVTRMPPFNLEMNLSILKEAKKDAFTCRIS